MNVFIIHRSVSRAAALHAVIAISKKHSLVLNPIVLTTSHGEEWKNAASSKIESCEAVLVFDPKACLASRNAAWEIERAEELKKPLISFDPLLNNNDDIDRLCSIYHLDDEFNSLFQSTGKDTEFLYKMMVESSEQLVQRRQRMNAFFITAIGGLLAIAGALEKMRTTQSASTSFLAVACFGIACMLLCNSWRNLINNYGKLNAAKFRVILKLEQALSAQVYSAEWAALGKGLRPQKYKSFTDTENHVPLWFAVLIFTVIMGGCCWQIWG